MNTLVIVLIAAVLLSAAYVLYGRWLANKWGIDPKAETPAKKFEDGKETVLGLVCTVAALVERTIGLVSFYAALATFLVEGLQLIIAILLMALALLLSSIH